jgi:hypothetical protein
MRDSFIFYRSFFEATKPLEPEQRAKLFDAICRFSLDLEEIQLDPICGAMFTLIKPQLIANFNKYKAGKKSAERKQKANRKGTEKEQKGNRATTNVNENDNLNKNKNLEYYAQFKHLKLTHQEHAKLLKDYSPEQVDDMLDQIWNFKGNTKYTSLYLTLKNWLKKDNQNDKKRASDFNDERTFGISV